MHAYPASSALKSQTYHLTTLTSHISYRTPLLHRCPTLTCTHRLNPTARPRCSTLPAPPRRLDARPRTPARDGTMAEAAQRMLMREFKDLSKEAWTHIEVRLPEQHGEKTFLECSPSHAEHPANRPQLINENVFEWSVALIVLNEDSLYYGGYFKAKMTFPRNYPHSPPGTSLPAHACHCISCMNTSSRQRH
jgi:ubiquitin-protein ligase